MLFGKLQAPYFPGPEFDFSRKDSSGSSSEKGKAVTKLTQEARELWGGYRGMEEYAREAFPVEEEANGLDWMVDKTVT